MSLLEKLRSRAWHAGIHLYASEATEALEALERARVVGVLDAWADSHETDGTVELVRAMGDGASWGLKLSRASNRSDPSELSVHDISYYDEDGNRCWFFESETADAARAAAAKAIEAGEV